MYRPPGTRKIYGMGCIMAKSTGIIFLVIRGHSIASESGSPGSCFLNAPKSPIHLCGAVAACSSSKSLISGMGKLGRKRVLSRHTRWSAVTQTTRCRVVSSKALQIFICSPATWATKRSSMYRIDINIPCAVPRYRLDKEMCKLWSVNRVEYSRASWSILSSPQNRR